MSTKKRTYKTNADLMSFGRYLVSDQRRLKLQRECRAKLKAGTINPIPWSIAERIVTKQDVKDWENWEKLTCNK